MKKKIGTICKVVPHPSLHVKLFYTTLIGDITYIANLKKDDVVLIVDYDVNTDYFQCLTSFGVGWVFPSRLEQIS